MYLLKVEEEFFIEAQSSPNYNNFGAGQQLLYSETGKANGISLQKFT